ncbi:MAG TPA: peptidoglycan DD-metalloendopeptidase family protein [Candidatus Tyrphobacter sp.]|nr:peptidoglycan DD-metalloendopeptidase family protein [Candidatus Tyrphobacter sp.]
MIEKTKKKYPAPKKAWPGFLRKGRLYGAISLVLVGCFFSSFGAELTLAATSSPPPADLNQSIADKTKELQIINQQIAQTQAKIDQVTSQKQSLQRDLSQIDYNVNQLNLSIQSSQVNIQKLDLELQLLQGKQVDVENSISVKKEAVGEVLRRIQEESNQGGTLALILSKSTLSDSVFELQSLRDIQNGLSVNVSELANLDTVLSGTIDATNQKQSDIKAEQQNLVNRKSIVVQEKADKTQVLEVTKGQESVYQSQYNALINQQNAIADEIYQMEQQLKSRIQPGAIPQPTPGLFAWPLLMADQGGTGHITQLYGHVDPSLYGMKPHNGLDIGTPVGTLIYAAADGVVAHVDCNDVNAWRKYQYGCYVLIEHPDGLSTLYAHLAKQVVSDGEQVKRGELIGYSDTTGYATGPHLHFGVYITPPGGWQVTTTAPGLMHLPPAQGLVPVGVTLNPIDYLSDGPSACLSLPAALLRNNASTPCS